MKVSVIVPAFNEEKNLHHTLQTLRDQSYPHIELIVIDNNSTDATGEIARQFTSQVFLEERPGYMSAAFRGAQEASGELITFCDADTRYPPDWLERVVSVFMQRSDIVAVYGTCITYDASKLQNIFNWTVYTGLILSSRYLWRFDNTSGFNFVIKRSAYDQAGGYDPNYRRMSPDIQLGRRLRRLGPLVLDVRLCVGTSFRRFQKGGKWKTFISFMKSWVEMVFGGDPSETYDAYNQKAR